MGSEEGKAMGSEEDKSIGSEEGEEEIGREKKLGSL
jgi:hypothetical protein